MKTDLRKGPTIVRRLPWILTAWSCLGLGAAGALLPLLPTTPFLLLAAWAAPKGSPGLEQWLLNHPRLGPPIEHWRTGRRISLRAKITAIVMLIGSWFLLWLSDRPPELLVALALLFFAVGGYLLSRPTSEGD